jgi:transcriptional regulator with XRE-family HTH domain
MNISDRIREVRKQEGLSQTAFGEKIMLTRSSIYQMENEQMEPSVRTIDTISRVFNVNKEWLETGEGEMYNLPTDEEEEIFQRLALKTDVSAQVLKMVIKWYVTLNDEGIARLDEMIEEELKKASHK